MAAYAEISDLYLYGFREEARGDLTDQVLSAHLDNAARVIDGHLGQRFGQPLTTWTPEVTSWNARIATYTAMTGPRGLSSDSPDYQVMKDSYDATMATLRRVQSQDYTPVGLIATASPGAMMYQPNVQSFSVVNLATGARGTSRGWT